MKKRKKNTISESVKVSKLIKDDGQSDKLEGKRINFKRGLITLFGKDVNDPSERGHD
jgi:hypothetical protein